MAYRGPDAPGAKLAYAALIGAALTRIAVAGQDPVGLTWLQPGPRLALDEVRAAFGYAAFEMITARLAAAGAVGDLSDDAQAVNRCVRTLARRSRKGSVIVLLSDFLDIHQAALREFLVLASAPRAIVFVQVLDPRERDLSFRGKVRLKAIEGGKVVVTDADAVRAEYRERLEQHTRACRDMVEREGGRLIEACTSDDPVIVMRRLLQGIMEARR